MVDIIQKFYKEIEKIEYSSFLAHDGKDRLFYVPTYHGISSALPIQRPHQKASLIDSADGQKQGPPSLGFNGCIKLQPIKRDMTSRPIKVKSAAPAMRGASKARQGSKAEDKTFLRTMTGVYGGGTGLLTMLCWVPSSKGCQVRAPDVGCTVNVGE
ncbi:MAG: hypothetical protein LQ351_006632 [Letrouitia transgressa]|nr:MAG: hypothetical protein LQ351_006632 [Letrouitia transgressa]